MHEAELDRTVNASEGTGLSVGAVKTTLMQLAQSASRYREILEGVVPAGGFWPDVGRVWKGRIAVVNGWRPPRPIHRDFGNRGNYSCEYMIIAGEYC
jgi:hypothetical protein